MLRHNRVILVIGNLKLGGAERQAFLLARELIRKHGARLEVWGFAGPGPSPHVWEEHAIPWKVVRFPWARKRARRTRRLLCFAWKLRRARPDVVLSFTLYPNVACGLTWRRTGARSFLWGQRDVFESLVEAELERRAVRSTPSFISNSEHARDFMDRTLGVPPERIEVIRNGVEMPSPKESPRAWRSRLGVDEGCFSGCMVAHLHGRKDHATLIRSWRIVADRLARRKVRAVLVLAGGRRQEPGHLQALVAELDLAEHVRFLGFVSDVSGLLAAVDVGVFSSRSEGCPNGVLECMDAGLAVAGTDVPGIREALGPEGLPFLAPPGDEQRLAEAILDLAESPALRERVGAANRERICREFTVEEIGARYAAVIRKELSAPPRRVR
ncbi:MAG: glycosyltransferase [Deltaproteobacteria bacterium]|nr:glycosyltransferase [Deltaproteobacteria bacterium]